MIVITVARKPLEGTVAQTVMGYGTGGLNIGACRLRTTEVGKEREYKDREDRENWRITGGSTGSGATSSAGRWPANLILQHHPDCVRLGTVMVDGFKGHTVKEQADGHIQFNHKPPGYEKVNHTDADGKEPVETWHCAPGCPVQALDGQSGVSTSQVRVEEGAGEHLDPSREDWRFKRVPGGYVDTGGASRYFKRIGGRS